MKTIIFEPAAYNMSETTRTRQIAGCTLAFKKMVESWNGPAEAALFLNETFAD